MKYFIKRLPKNMICDLKKAREIELSEAPGNICFFYNFYGTLSALHQRRLVETKNIILNGREILSISVTQLGIKLLKKYEEYKHNLKTSPKWNLL